MCSIPAYTSIQCRTLYTDKYEPEKSEISTKSTPAFKGCSQLQELRNRHVEKHTYVYICEYKIWVAKGSTCSDSADGNKILIITI